MWAVLLTLAGLFANSVPGVFDVRDYGAKGDGTSVDTVAIQSAIDACTSAGGGTVRVPPGKYLTGTLRVKDGVLLDLSQAAVLLGSSKLEDYADLQSGYRSYTERYTRHSLIYAENAHDVGITGTGTISGQGAAFPGEYKMRPYLVRFVACDGVTLDGVTLRDGAMWAVHFLGCNRVYTHNVTIHSRVNRNNDGLDIDSSSNVRISDCDISSGDDAIVLKSTSAQPCRNVVISNCVLSTDCNALKMGTESNGGFQNVTISNCTIYDTHLSGIALEIVDGGLMDGIAVSNISMRNVGAPIFIRLGDRARPFADDMPRPGVGELRNISINHVVATGADDFGCSITGIPGHPVENVAISDIRIEFAGGGTDEDAKRVPEELPDKYPEYRMFGKLPAYGFYTRHVKGLRFVDIDVSTATPDARPPFAKDDVQGLELIRFHSPNLQSK